MNDQEKEPPILRDLGGEPEEAEVPKGRDARYEKIRDHLINRHLQGMEGEGDPQKVRAEWIAEYDEHLRDILEDGDEIFAKFDDEAALDLEHKLNERVESGVEDDE